jgi:hypothetical protein
MKRIIILLSVVVVVGSLFTCLAAGWLVWRGPGRVVTVERPVSDFSAVDLATFGDLHIEQGDTESLRIEAEENVLPYLETEVSGHTLKLKERPNSLIFHNRPVKFYLTVKKLDVITLSGSGDIDMPRLAGDELTLNIRGSGEIKIGQLEARQVRMQIDGSGDITIAGGKIDQQQIGISGSGSYDARNLTSAEAQVQVSGSGDVALHVNDRLAINISGSGDVRYLGRPSVEQHVSGSGEIESIAGS